MCRKKSAHEKECAGKRVRAAGGKRKHVGERERAHSRKKASMQEK